MRPRPRRLMGAAGCAMVLGLPAVAGADGPVGTALPDDFPVILDHSLRQPVLGFGAQGPVMRRPVVFLHGNNDTPYPTACNAFGHIRDFAEYFHDRGYARSELWALGYQGDQCDLLTQPTNRSSEAHSTVANVPDLGAFVNAVLRYTGATQVDIVGHSLGGTLAREWLRQDGAYDLVRTLVTVDSPHHGIINCSPSPQNYYALPAAGGFDPESAICREYGAADTPLLATLNAGDETPGSTAYLALRNADTSFVYFSKQDGAFPAVPAEDHHGRPHDFSLSAALDGGVTVDLTGQGRYDEHLATAHYGINNSPEAWRIAHRALADTGRPAGAARGADSRVRVPARLRARVRPRRDRRPPYRFSTRGRVVPPTGVARRDACRTGTIAVRVKAARRTVSTRRARLDADCRFASSVVFTDRRRLANGRLAFHVDFFGNQALTPGTARRRARAG